MLISIYSYNKRFDCLTMQSPRQDEDDFLSLKRKAPDPNERKPMPTGRVRACTCCRQVKVGDPPSPHGCSMMLSQDRRFSPDAILQTHFQPRARDATAGAWTAGPIPISKELRRES